MFDIDVKLQIFINEPGSETPYRNWILHPDTKQRIYFDSDIKEDPKQLN